MATKSLTIPYGIRAGGQGELDQLVFVDEIPVDQYGLKCGLVCPECGGQLEMHRVDGKPGYLCHYAGDSSSCAGPHGDTLVHVLSERVLSEMVGERMGVPFPDRYSDEIPHVWDSWAMERSLVGGIQWKIVHVDIERTLRADRYSVRRPDALVTFQYGRHHSVFMTAAVEIFVTHAKELETVEYFAERYHLPVFEIKIPKDCIDGLELDDALESLRERLTNPYRDDRQWLWMPGALIDEIWWDELAWEDVWPRIKVPDFICNTPVPLPFWIVNDARRLCARYGLDKPALPAPCFGIDTGRMISLTIVEFCGQRLWSDWESVGRLKNRFDGVFRKYLKFDSPCIALDHISIDEDGCVIERSCMLMGFNGVDVSGDAIDTKVYDRLLDYRPIYDSAVAFVDADRLLVDGRSLPLWFARVRFHDLSIDHDERSKAGVNCAGELFNAVDEMVYLTVKGSRIVRYKALAPNQDFRDMVAIGM